MLVRSVLLSLSVFVMGDVANSATFSAVDSKDGKTRVNLDGDIAPGDSEDLKAVIQKANDAGKVVVTIRLNSKGGNLLEGVTLSEIIRKGRIATAVLSGAQCASACFIIFAAGNERYAHHSALIGVHGASDANGQETVRSGAATVTMARVVKELGVPPSVIGKMVVTPPDKMVWLTLDDLRAMDTKMFGKPMQVGSEPSPESSMPRQITPDTRAATSPSPTWEELLKKAISLSSSQNNGKPRYFRFCQPEIKTCSLGVSYTTSTGKEGALKMVEDLGGKIIKREVCVFNEFSDVRDCFDWDTGIRHKDMKNMKGEWYSVSEQ